MKVVKHPTSPVKKLTTFSRTYLNHNQVLIANDLISIVGKTKLSKTKIFI